MSKIALLAFATVTCGSSPDKPQPVPPEQAQTPPAGEEEEAPPPVEEEPPPAEPVADGGECFAAADCTSGICEGEGCGSDTPGTCQPKSRMCTRDARSYCGCDGKTFVGSGSCPGARYSKAGACDGDPGPLGGGAKK